MKVEGMFKLVGKKNTGFIFVFIAGAQENKTILKQYECEVQYK